MEPHLIYTIRGPSGVYVGHTNNAEYRWHSHRTRAVGGPSKRTDGLIHVAMRRDGVERYTFSVFACAAGKEFARDAERAVIAQLRADGQRVLNVVPRLPGHTPPRFGKVDYVVVDGARQAL